MERDGTLYEPRYQPEVKQIKSFLGLHRAGGEGCMRVSWQVKECPIPMHLRAQRQASFPCPIA